MKHILFICVENACRSQMAEAFFNKLAFGKAEAVSAGTKPADRVNRNAVKGITIGLLKAAHFTDDTAPTMKMTKALQ